MILIYDGNSEIGAHVRNNLCHLICSRHLLWSRIVMNRIFFPPKNLFSFMRAQNCSWLSTIVCLCFTHRIWWCHWIRQKSQLENPQLCWLRMFIVRVYSTTYMMSTTSTVLNSTAYETCRHGISYWFTNKSLLVVPNSLRPLLNLRQA